MSEPKPTYMGKVVCHWCSTPSLEKGLLVIHGVRKEFPGDGEGMVVWLDVVCGECKRPFTIKITHTETRILETAVCAGPET